MIFVKLELTWATSPWLLVLSGNARLCWVMLLCYAKASGSNGRVKALAPRTAATLWFIGEEDVRQMEQAAINDGALTTECGDWIITNWVRYQGDPTHAERQRRYREIKKRDGSDASRASHAENAVEEKRREEKRRESIDSAKAKGKPSELSEVTDYYWETMPDANRISECEKFFDHFESNGWKQGGKTPMRDWKASFRNWMRNAKNIGGHR